MKNKSVLLVLFLSVNCLFFSIARADSVRFAVVSDTQGLSLTNTVNPVIFPEIVDHILKADPPVQFVIVTGDLAIGSPDDQVLRDQFSLWRQLAQPWYQSNMIGAKVYVLPGNHDLRSRTAYSQIWQQAFPEIPDNGPETSKKMTYSFDAGPCHLVALQTYRPGEGFKVDLEWLAQDLANSSAPVKLVFGHAPAFPIMLHIGTSLDQFPDLRDRFWDILAQNNVQAYFCGHEHVSDRWIYNNVQQIIMGSGGGYSVFFQYLIVDADENDVTVNVHLATTGELYNQYKLSETQSARTDDRSDPERTVLDAVPCLSSLIVVLPLFFLSFSVLTKE